MLRSPALSFLPQPIKCVAVAWGLFVLVMSLGVTPLAIAAPRFQADSSATITVAMPAPTDLDPVSLSRFDPYSRDLVENLFIGLTRFNPDTQQIEPLLARSWTVSADQLTWTFDLRDDIQWIQTDPETGEIIPVRPVAAGDFVYTIQRACDPLRPSPLTANLMIVHGCQTVANAFPEIISDLFIAREIGVRATGPTTLEIRLRFPASHFPTLLSTPEFRPVPREAVTASEDWTMADSRLTNGPYALKNWSETGLSLVTNPFWPDSLAGNVGQVDVVYSAEGDILTTLADKPIDMARIPSEAIAAAQASFPGIVHITEGTTLTVLGFSQERAIISSPDVRRALAFAIDRESLVATLMPGNHPQTAFTPTGVVAAPAVDHPGNDSAAAQAAFAAAGHPGCDSIPEQIVIAVRDDDPTWVQLAQALSVQWNATLGCNPALFKIQPTPRLSLIEMSHASYDAEHLQRSHLWITTWSADYPDSDAWIAAALHCQYGYLRVGRECEQADTLLDQAILENDPVVRANLYAQAENLFFGKEGTFPVIPLFMSNSAWVQQPWLSYINIHGAARYDLWSVDTGAQRN